MGSGTKSGEGARYEEIDLQNRGYARAEDGHSFLFQYYEFCQRGKKWDIQGCAAQRSAGRRNETGDFVSGSARKAHGRRTHNRTQEINRAPIITNHKTTGVFIKGKQKNTTQQQIPCQPIQEEEEEKEKPRITERCHVLYSHSSSSLSSLSSLSSSEELSPVLRLSFGLLCAWLGAWLGFPEAAPTRS